MDSVLPNSEYLEEFSFLNFINNTAKNIFTTNFYFTHECFYTKTCLRSNFEVLCKNLFSLLLWEMQSIKNILEVEKECHELQIHFSSTNIIQRQNHHV